MSKKTILSGGAAAVEGSTWQLDEPQAGQKCYAGQGRSFDFGFAFAQDGK